MPNRSLASRSFLCVGLVSLAIACGNSADSGSDGNGGSSNSSGGETGKGGASAANGGSNAAGGAFGSGGSASGGALGSGGSATGGNSASNGGASSGGAANGGASNTSGASNGGSASGGKSATGGQNAGGTTAGGGATATGGKAAGGATASGGKASGGTTGNAGSTGTAGAGTAGTAGAGTGTGGANTGTTPLKIWIAGDSTVQNCSSACPCGWGGQFDPLFNTNVTVQNSAVGGRSIQTWLYEANVSSTLTNGECPLTSNTYNARWTAMTNASTGMKSGDYLFIQFGINDGDSTCPRHVGLTLFKTYLGAMAQAAKDRGAHPIFLTPVSAISCNSSGKAVGTRGAFVTATIEAGMTYGVPVIDLHQLSVDLYNSLGFCPNNSDYSSGIVGAFFCDDHTHFEAAGAQQIAKIIAKALRDQKIPLAAYLL